MRRLSIVTVLTLCGLVGAGQAGAAEATKATNEPPAPAQAAASAPVQASAQACAGASAPVPVAGAGLVAFVDLTTGQLVEPSAAQAAALAQAREFQSLNMSFEGLTEVPLPGGGYMVDLRGRFQSMLVATVGPDGKLRMGHPVAAAPVPAEGVPPAKARKEGDRK